MLVDGFNDLHGFRASVPDDGEFDGVMGFAVPVFHVSVKERGAALLTLLSQFRQSNVEEVDVGQPPWFAIGSSEIVVPCVRVGSLDRFGKHGDVTRRASDDCQYCANRHDPVRVTHVDVLKPIRNSIHDVQSTTGGVSCRI